MTRVISTTRQSVRKEQVARVTWQLLAKNGFESTSMREIAMKLGTSTGVLTHYFRNKDDLVEFTYEYMFKLVRRRLADASSGSAKSSLANSIKALLPNKKAHLDNHKVWLSFVTAGFGRPKLRARNKKIFAAYIANMAALVEQDRERRETKPKLSASDEADLLMCLTEGLSTLAAIDPNEFSPERVNHLAEVGFDLIVGSGPT